MELFALDLGNIQTKIKSSKKEKVLPSKFVYYKDLGNQSTSISERKLDINEYETIIDDNFSYAWGSDVNLAKVRTFLDTIGFENRYSSPNFKLLATFAIGELAKDFQQAKDGILEVNIVTGVPTDEFNEVAVKSLMKVLKSDHNITINGERLAVRVNEVKVLPQPTGTVYNELLDSEGYIENENYENETISVVDCGGGTVLIDTLNDMNLSEVGRNQEEYGAHALYDEIIHDCKQQGIPLTKNDIEKIIKEQEDKYFYKPNKDESYDITDVVKRNIIKYTNTLLSIIDSTLKGTSHIDTLFFTGGGANIINKKQILERYKRATFIKNSEVANVNGFYKYGLATIENDENE